MPPVSALAASDVAGYNGGMKRRWFQIHLNTAIVLMLSASGLVWLNVRLYRISEEHVYRGHLESGWDFLDGRGWPFCFQNIASTTHKWRPPIADGISVVPLAMDVAAIAMLQTLLAIGCESLIRRRERKHAMSESN